MELKHKITHVVPPAPKTFRGQPSFIEAGPQYLLYFNGPTVILRPYDNGPSLFISHSCQVNAVKYSYGHKQIASIDEKGTLLIHIISGQGPNRILRQIYNYQSVYFGAKSMDWTSDNKRIGIVGAGKGKFGKIIGVETGSEYGQITGVSANLSTVSFRPQRPFKAATGGQQFTIKFYEGPPYKFSCSKVSHKNYINQIKYSPDGKKFVSVGSDRKIVMYDGLTCQILKQLEGAHAGGIMGVTWLDNDTFVTGGSDKKLKKWSANLQPLAEADSNENKQQLSLIDSFVVGVSYIAAKQSIYYVLLSGQIKQIDTNLQKYGKSFEGYRGKVIQIISIPQQSNSVLLIDDSGKIFKLTIDKQNYTIQRYLRHVLCYNKVFYDACISNDMVYVLGGESQIHALSIKNIEGPKIQNIQVEGAVFLGPVHSSHINAFVAFSIDKIRVYQENNGKFEKVGEHKLLHEPKFTKVSVDNNPQSNLIFVGSQKGYLQILKIQVSEQKSIKISKLTQCHTNKYKITFIQKHEDILFTGDSAGNIKVHKLNNQNQNFQLVKITDSMGGSHTTLISSINIINSSIYTLSFDNRLIIWNLSQYSRVKTFLDVHRHGVLSGNVVAGAICSSGGDFLVKLHEF